MLTRAGETIGSADIVWYGAARRDQYREVIQMRGGAACDYMPMDVLLLWRGTGAGGL
jgi:hypothetical protein